MEKEKINLKIITPTRTVLSDTVDSVTVFTTTGQLTILPKHANLFAPVTEGELKIVKHGEESFFATGKGLLKVGRDSVALILEDAFHSDEINENEVVKAREAAEKILKEKPKGEDSAAARAIFRRSLIELKVARRRRRVNP